MTLAGRQVVVTGSAGFIGQALSRHRLALGEDVQIRNGYDAIDDYYMVRDLDMQPGIYHADELFEGIEEVR